VKNFFQSTVGPMVVSLGFLLAHCLFVFAGYLLFDTPVGMPWTLVIMIALTVSIFFLNLVTKPEVGMDTRFGSSGVSHAFLLSLILVAMGTGAVSIFRMSVLRVVGYDFLATTIAVLAVVLVAGKISKLPDTLHGKAVTTIALWLFIHGYLHTSISANLSTLILLAVMTLVVMAVHQYLVSMSTDRLP
jgi:hypothetical protein